MYICPIMPARSRALPAPSPSPPIEGRAREILEAGLRIVAAEGGEAVTHRRVAAEAGVPLGSTTYYFDSRDALLREAFRCYVAGVFEMIAALEREFLRPTWGALVDFLVEITRRELLTPKVLVVEYELLVRAARDPVLAAAFRDYERTLVSRIAETLERLGAPQPFDGARTLVAIVRGFELESLLGGGPDPEDLRRRLGPVVAALAPPRDAAGGTAPPHARLRRRRKP
jgi:TetR/AcrR family transcriptional regulator, regulator of biofilm formation and stress response